MKILNSDEIKKISINILDDVAVFCEKNNIRYYLGCGTLLGAVRHKGFIPWDDDIDVLMPRPDYKRFINEYNGKYKVLKPSEGIYYYAKVYDQNTLKIEEGKDYNKYSPLGIDIDIFPLDGIVDNEKIINKLMKRSAFLETLHRLSNQPIFYRKNPIKCINRIIPRIIGSKNLVKMIDKNASSYEYDRSDYVIRMRNSSNGTTGALKKEIYDPAVKLEFEEKQYYVPRDYDTWLTRFFGNYMELPPENKRMPHHKNKCYLKDNNE